jgi:predicted PurR-regulated permease PerM
MALVALGLGLTAAVTFAPFWASMVLGVWAADALEPAVRKGRALLGSRSRAAAWVVVLFVATVFIPLVALVASIANAVHDLAPQVQAALEGHGTLTGVLFDAGTQPTSLRDWAALGSRYGASAWAAVAVLARTSTSFVLAVVVFLVTLVALSTKGARVYRTLVRYSPLPPRVLARFTRAFRETGRGLIIGTGGTALVQGLIATIAYVVIGIPRALLLGPLTAVCALVPAVGTALLWLPLAAGFALRGDYMHAGWLVVAGLFISTIDNVVRPVLTRRGRLRLPMSIVFVSLVGGIAAFGPTGMLLGPLLVRLSAEAFAIARDEKLFAPTPSGDVGREARGAERVPPDASSSTMERAVATPTVS